MDVISESINIFLTEYSSKIFLAFISLVATSFVLTSLKEFIVDLIYYFRARMSDIGFGQAIYWNNEIYYVMGIKFKYLEIEDEDKIVRVPLRTYLKGSIVYPKNKSE